MKRVHRKYVAYVAAMVALTAAIVGELQFFVGAYRIDFEEQAQRKLHVSAQLLDSAFADVRVVSETITHSLTYKSIDKNHIGSLMDTLITQYSIDGLMFILQSPDNESHNYALLLSKLSGSIPVPSIANVNSYSRHRQYYDEAIAKGRFIWINPVYDEIFGERIVACCVPFALAGGEKGMIMVIYKTLHIYDRLQGMGLNRYGLPYIMDSSTVFVAHPLDETRSLGELGNDYNDPSLIRLTSDLKDGKRLDKSYIHSNTVTGQECNEIFAPINETGWLLGLSAYDGRSLESALYRQSMKRSAIRITILAALWLIFAITLLNERLQRRHLYSYLYPFLFLWVIVCVIAAYNMFSVHDFTQDTGNVESDFERVELYASEQKLLDKHKIFNKWDPQRIVDTQSLHKFLNNYSRQSRSLYNEPVRIIPTGLYLYAIQFTSSYEVRITGSFWQKFLVSDSTQLPNSQLQFHTCDYPKKGIMFPGAHVNEYRQTDSIPIFMDGRPATLCRWVFDVDIPQKFSHSLFPFGKNELRLPLWSVDLDDNTVIIPDLEAERQTYPDICPGLGNNFAINGWNILSSYYSYTLESYLSNFGNSEMQGINRFPELTFNVPISRKFLDSLVCKIIPIFIILVLLFTILFVRKEDDGFNNVIGCSGLFFVLIFDHINLRESVLSDGIIYLEYCYFFTYLLLLLITVTSFRLGKDSTINKYVQLADSVLRQYFWAIILGFMAVTTILKFY